MQTYELANQTGDVVFAIVQATGEQAAIDAARQDPRVAKRMESANQIIAVAVTYAEHETIRESHDEQSRFCA